MEATFNHSQVQPRSYIQTLIVKIHTNKTYTRDMASKRHKAIIDIKRL